jgi:uncharacterized membrane protein YphA (DoxX/SURF4 family)
MTKQKLSDRSLNTPLLAILFFIGLIWLRSSFGKVLGGEFVQNMGQSVGYFASKNPYPFVKDFLQSTVLPNASFFGNLTMWGEVFVALAITGSVLSILLTRRTAKPVLYVLLAGLLGGIFFNKIFWFSAGWTSPSTDSVNLVMLGVQLVGLIVVAQLVRKA